MGGNKPKYFIPYLWITNLLTLVCQHWMCIFMKLCKGTWMGGHDCSGFEKDIPRWVGLVLVRCSPVAAVIECDVGSSFFPIFTFSLLQMLCARSPYSSLKKITLLKKMVPYIYIYVCMNIALSVLLVSCRRIKWITLEAETNIVGTL